MLSGVKFLACLVLLAATVQSGLAVDWKICEGADKLWKPLGVTISPDPAVAGQDVAFEIKGISDRIVDGGYLVASVTFEGMPIAEEIKDLCKRTSCPIQAGPVDVIYGQNLPPFVPPGAYEVQVQLKTSTDELLMCIVVDFNINAPPMKQLVNNLIGKFTS